MASRAPQRQTADTTLDAPPVMAARYGDACRAHGRCHARVHDPNVASAGSTRVRGDDDDGGGGAAEQSPQLASQLSLPFLLSTHPPNVIVVDDEHERISEVNFFLL